MSNEYKRILLQKGLDPLNDYHFRMVKSLLVTDLSLTKTMQKDYDKIHIADLMAEKFPGVVCVEKLINLIKDVPELKDIVDTLKKEKTRVTNKLRAKVTLRESNPEEGPSTSCTATSRRTEETPKPQKKKTPVSQKQTPKTTQAPPASDSNLPSTSNTEVPRPVASSKPATPSSILQKSPLKVMVVTATKMFDYEIPEQGKITMFHAIVVTETEVFHVKVFNPQLKNKFTSKKIIIMSDYFKNKGFLEVKENSSITEANLEPKMTVSNVIIKAAKDTPKIILLQNQASGTIVNGSFKLNRKTIKGKKTIYEIQDDSGTMDVVGEGRWHDMVCEVGDQLQLTCFQLRVKDQKKMLVAETHSYIQIKNTKPKNPTSVNTQPPKKQSQLPEVSAVQTTQQGNQLQTTESPSTSNKMYSTEDLFLTVESEQCQASLEKTTVKTEEPTSTQSTWEMYQHLSKSLLSKIFPGTSDTSFSAPAAKKQKLYEEPSREEGTQQGPKEVVVLMSTDPFAYEGILGEKWMFHATVATENQFFKVKVFDISLKEKFTEGNIIAMSHYIGRSGFLEIYNVSSVCVLHNRQIKIPAALIHAATATLQICHLVLKDPGTCVNGVYQVFGKTIRNACVYYKIQDQTGEMEVLVYGRLTSIDCNIEDTVELICFEISEDRRQLRSIAHSFLKVLKTKGSSTQSATFY